MGLFIALPFVGGYIGFLQGQAFETTNTNLAAMAEQLSETLPKATEIAANPIPAPIATSTAPSEKVPLEGSKYFTINNLTLEVTFASSVAQQVTVRDKGTITQTFSAPTEPLREGDCIQENQEIKDVLQLQDINFDGYLDLGMLGSEGGAHCAYDFFIYYLFDPTTRQFATSSPLQFGNLSANPETKTLTFLIRDGIKTNQVVYYYRDGTYHLAEKTILYHHSAGKTLEDLRVGSGD